MQPFTERSGNSEGQPNANVRMTVQEAADALGITVEAVRGRIHRGKYGREKTKDGRVFVLLSPDQLANERERFGDRSDDRSDDQTANVPPSDHALVRELVEELAEGLRQEVEFLRAELRRREEEHREESRRKDHIIMSLTQRIPELEPPRDASREPREAPETASETEGGGDAAPAAQEKRSWLHRFFFGP